MTSENPQVFKPLPGRKVDRSAYEAVLRDLLGLAGAEPPEADVPGVPPSWHHRARRVVGKAVKEAAETSPETSPEEWFEPLMRAAVQEPDPGFVRELIKPAMAAYGRRRVMLALIGHLDTGTPADIAGAARAWYWTQVPVSYLPGGDSPTPESVAEHEAHRDLRERYSHTALRRFVDEDSLDVRRRILPGLTLDPASYPDDLHDLVTEAVRIARTSSDDYLRQRVEIQAVPGE
jgi:hypothetical protein